jgi:hypothetical protein
MRTHSRRRRYSPHVSRSRRVRENEKPELSAYLSRGRLETEIAEFISSVVEPTLYQKGLRLGRLDELGVAIESGHRRPLLSFQLGSQRIRRKIIDVRRREDSVLEIDLQHFNQLETLEIRSVDDSLRASFFRSSRRSFQRNVESMVLKNFPKLKILNSLLHSDLEHSLSGKYVRMLLMSGRNIWAALAVSPWEDQTTVDGILTQGLIWLEHLKRKRQPVPSQLLLLVPRDREQILKSRLNWIQAAGREILLVAMDVDRESLVHVDPGDSGNVNTLLTHLYAFTSKPDCSQNEQFRRLMTLCPQLIEPICQPEANAVGFRIRGLEFARLHLGRSSGLTFGVGRQSPVVTTSDWKRLEGLVDEIRRQRRSVPQSRRHAYYRFQAERWLESLILRYIQLIEPTLDPGYVYPQVPAFLGSDRGMIDILSVTKGGRLAVLELKVSEDLDLPIQGLDYWLRVRWHQFHQEFLGRGYFKGIQLSTDLPVLYFVCPQFCYHDTFPRIIKYFHRSIPLVQVGINQDWRAGLQILGRRQFNFV